MKSLPQGKLSPKIMARFVWVVMFALTGINIVARLIYTNASFAADGGDVLVEWVNDNFAGSGSVLPSLVGVIAVLVIIAAGVIYAFDLGGGKQSGLAKEMIISAISGVILFMLSSWLLNQLSGPGGLFYRGELNNPTTQSSNPMEDLGPGGSDDSNGNGGTANGGNGGGSGGGAGGGNFGGGIGGGLTPPSI